MKNATKNMVFPQDLVDNLMESFSEDSSKFTRLSSPLSNVNFTSNEDNEN